MELSIFAFFVFVLPFGILMGLIVFFGIRRKEGKRWPVIVGAIWAVILLIVTLILGFVAHWGEDLTVPHPYEDGKPAYCEGYQPRDGYDPVVSIGPSKPNDVIAQQESVWSDLGFMTAGLFVLFLMGRARNDIPNPMTDARSWNPSESLSWYPLGLGLIIIFMGPGSMFYHGSISNTLGWFDSMSIMLWMIFSLCYSLMRIFRWHWGLFVGLFAGLVIVIGILNNFIPSFIGYVLFGGAFGVLDLIVAIRSAMGNPWRGVSRSLGWYLATLVSFLVALGGLWIFEGGATNSACPAPYSVLQPHPWFQILSAFVTLFGYLYFASETRKDAASA